MSASSAPSSRSLAAWYVDAFARAISRFASPGEGDLLRLITTLPCADFAANRCELWLWDDSSGSAYLVHSAGADATHRREYLAADAGPLAVALGTRRPVENVVLSACGPNFEPLVNAGLARVSAYPLLAAGSLLGALALYTREDAGTDILQWWRMYADASSVALRQALDVEHTQKTIQQLSLLFEATRLLNSTLDLAELLELILRIARTEVKAERGSVFLVDSRTQELWSIVASGLNHQEIRLPMGAGIAGRVAQSGQTVNVEDAYSLPFFDRSFDQKFGYHTRSLLCLPIRHHTGDIVGVIQLLNKEGGPRFTAEDEDFLSKLSGHMALALENARLHREALEKQRMERDLALARGIQRSLLPDAPPVVPGYDVAVVNEPCWECGGDYYDFLSLGPHTLLLVVADVEGKGVSSALVMSNLQATLRALVMHLHSLEVLALSLNEMICTDTKSEKYLSMFLGLVDTRRNGLHYINAGHCPPMLIDGRTGQYRLLEEGGTVIGMFPNADYTRGSARMKAGDILVLCTDGILEAANRDEEEYGHARLADCVFRHRSRPAQAIIDAVLAEVNAFATAGPHHDDKVLMVLKVEKDSGPHASSTEPAVTTAVTTK
ncbi:MAG: PP2C family protein-serine/threonine phosphatase [Terriglobales bacterium]